MKWNTKRWAIVSFTVALLISQVTSSAQAGNLLDELQVQDTCGTAYADKLSSCTPFRCIKPSPMAMMFGFPSEAELKKMPAQRQQKMRIAMAQTEQKLKAMSPQERAAMTAKMTSTLEVKGYDSTGRCQTSTLAIPGQQMDCSLDKTLLVKFVDYTRLAAKAEHIQVKSESRLVNGKMLTT